MPKETAMDVPFSMQVVSNSNVSVATKKGDLGVLLGIHAMKAAGAQSEFVAANILQAQALKCCIILRAGDPPQYNKARSPKSGVNLSKTSKQGFFKGSIAEKRCFSRISKDGEPQPHHPKDEAHLLLKPTHPEYQHIMQLDINMRDILREIGPEGDLQIVGFDLQTGFLRFEYKMGHGPKPDNHAQSGFNGQFVVNLYGGVDNSIFYSREWDKAEHDKDWDQSQGVITKPSELAALPDELYKQIFNHTFKLSYTQTKNPKPAPEELRNANVFANRARSASEFRETMGAAHPHYHLIKSCLTLEEVLSELKAHLSEEEAEKIILEVYNKGGCIIAGDWDGMALGHPPNLAPNYAEIINVFAPKTEGIKNKEKLLRRSDEYLKEIQDKAQEKRLQGEPLSLFEEKALSIKSMAEIVSDFALARAGCITTHEFVFQQILNHAYRDHLNAHYGEKYDTAILQQSMDKLVAQKDSLSPEQLVEILLTGDFLQKNHIDISHGADMAAGWGRVIQRQIELGQTIPPNTMEHYDAFLKHQLAHHGANKWSQLKESTEVDVPPIPLEPVESDKGAEELEQQSVKERTVAMKKELSALQCAPQSVAEEEQEIERANRLRG